MPVSYTHLDVYKRQRLFSEYDRKVKDYTGKKEVVHSEILLPPNAPEEYRDRAALWNAVEKVENQWNSQLARDVYKRQG